MVNLFRQVTQATKDGVDQLNKRQDDQERQVIIDWLTKIDYIPQQIDFTSKCQDGTGQWVLDSNEFQTWLNTSRQTLFCPGMPGGGKTMITSIIVNYLCTSYRKDANIGIAYIYCNFRNQEKQEPAQIFASLLRQLVQGRPCVPECVKSFYRLHKDKPGPPPNKILNILHAITAEYSRTFIVIDALDEIQVSDGGCIELLSEIFNIQTKTGINLFATSRLLPEILQAFKGSISLEISASRDDVRMYLEGHMTRLPSCVRRNSALQENIKTEIVKAVDGMYVYSLLKLV